MPWDKSKYPADWAERSRRIRERDGHRCQFCGVPNHTLVTRPSGKVTKIILTVAHLDEGPKDCPDERLAALCQRCHLDYDRKIHTVHSAITRRRKKEERGQIPMPFLV